MRPATLPRPLAALAAAACLSALPALAQQTSPPAAGPVTGDPVETLDGRLLPLPGPEDRQFAVGTLEGAPVALGDDSRVGTVRDVVVGLEEQRSFVVEYGDRLGGRTVLLPISETVIRDGRLIAAYTLNQLRALPTLNDYEAANLSPIASDETLRLRRSDLDFPDVEATGSRAYDPMSD
ncbi:PRC-barrel domain-containing protein [Salinarimonas rosea]|uniref:PRC-barrel domain-containing protein n=1 Tax=Salinarimonas rosea TaxID=552063 RepID=UPI00042740B6|nr:PRC-barrel domain-containing protein [Salinarimonas rosea]